MTNESLLHLGRTLQVDDSAVWLVENRVQLVCQPSANDEDYPDRYILLYDNRTRVGIISFIGNHDIHWLVFPEYRSRGYLSEFVRSGIIKIVEPDLICTTIDRYYCDEYEASEYLARLAGLMILRSEEEKRELYQHIHKEVLSHLNKPCHCGSGMMYKDCCSKRDEMDKYDEMHPCYNCNAYKSHSIATRCWKCGEEYDI
jgi:hypothetical protein